jgi:hypothetical protein
VTFLDKDQSGRRWCELRDLWNSWDPIGVEPQSGGPSDEYENYLGPSLRLLESSDSDQELQDYLEYVVGEYMGLGVNGVEYVRGSGFAKTLRSWFEAKWAGTHV